MKDDIAINVSGAARQFMERSLVDKIDAARSFGVNSIELHDYKEWDSLFDLSGRELRRIAEKVSGLDRISVHAPMGETFTIPDEAKSRQAIREDQASIRAAGFLGAQVVVIHVRMKHVKTDLDKRRAADTIRDLGDYADCFGVNLAVETSTDLEKPEDLADIIRYVDHPRIGVTVDTGHLLRCLSDADKKSDNVADLYNAVLHKAIDIFLAQRKIYHVHMNDIRAKTLWDHYGMGLGFVDFDGAVKKLVEGGYRGMFALEIHRGDGNEVSSISDEEVRAAIGMTRSLVDTYRASLGRDVPIRPAREGDIDEIAKIVREIWDIGFEYNFEQKFGRPDGVPWYDRTVPTIVNSVKGHLDEIIVAEIDGKVAGFMAHRVEADRAMGTIGYNGVGLSYRKRGIGGALLRRSLDILREKGMTHAKVVTGLNEGHRAARMMYERGGFEPLMESVTYAMKL